ncbi:hypothetical protein IJI17_03120 [Candidatus Saccharibacteria bacterium]|nr:hypothetical protein [Candidatus Saccharibacteria bacterium]
MPVLRDGEHLQEGVIMGKKFETKIIGGSSSYEMGLGFAFINEEALHLAHVEIKPPVELTNKCWNAQDVKIDLRPTALEYEDGSRTGFNMCGFVDKKCPIEEFAERPFKAYYNPWANPKKSGRGWIEIDLKED